MEDSAEVKSPTPPTPEAAKENPKLKTLIVFGQGPVKAIYLANELNPDQKKQWEEFKKDPPHGVEPEFRVIERSIRIKEDGTEVEGNAYYQNLDAITARTDITDEEKKQLTEVERQKWQNTGRLTLNHWGRMNALAAGAMLVAGDTEKLLLSGGQTMRSWMKESLPEERTDEKHWPSEAKLMKDIIVARFGSAYAKKYPGKNIEDALALEAESTNTLANIPLSINRDPDLLNNDGSVGLLGADFHTQRIVTLSHLFTVQEAPGGDLGAQSKLRERVQTYKAGIIKSYEKILDHMDDLENNEDLQIRTGQEQHWSEVLDTEANYWVGYVGLLKSPQVIQTVIDRLKDPKWVAQARIEFKKVDLDFDNLTDADDKIIKMAREDPAKYEAFRKALASHVDHFRKPPDMPTFNKKAILAKAKLNRS